MARCPRGLYRRSRIRSRRYSRCRSPRSGGPPESLPTKSRTRSQGRSSAEPVSPFRKASKAWRTTSDLRIRRFRTSWSRRLSSGPGSRSEICVTIRVSLSSCESAHHILNVSQMHPNIEPFSAPEPSTFIVESGQPAGPETERSVIADDQMVQEADDYGPFGNGLRLEHAPHLQPEVIVQARRLVFVHDETHCYASSGNALASCRSAVSRPSVNQA